MDYIKPDITAQTSDPIFSVHLADRIGAEGLFRLDVFAKIREGLKEHLITGQMDFLTEYPVYIFLHQIANIKTGMAYKTSAVGLSEMLGVEIKYFQKALVSLEKKGYIKRFFHRGTRKPYPIVINKFVTIDGLQIIANECIFDKVNSLYDNKLAFTLEDEENLKGICSELEKNLNGTYRATLKDILKINKDNKEVKRIKKIISKKDNFSYSPDFESFWNEYPKKVSKGMAYKRWKEAVKTDNPDVIIKGAKKYYQSVRKIPAKYIKNPDGWLSARRWEDDYSEKEDDRSYGLDLSNPEVYEKLIERKDG